jgi:hypothetical protein
MAIINLTENFNHIFDTLQKKNMNITGIAKSMGYTTSAQLHSALKGESLLSTKAIMSLIEKANVNPTYLFLGIGDMFLSDESEVEKLKKENQELIQRHNEVLKTIMGLNEIIKELEKRNTDLIEMSAAALKYYKGDKEALPINIFSEDPVKQSIEIMKFYREPNKQDEVEKKERESGGSLKRNKK